MVYHGDTYMEKFCHGDKKLRRFCMGQNDGKLDAMVGPKSFVMVTKRL